MKRAPDVMAVIEKRIKRDVQTFNEEDQRSGYAEWMARYWNSLPSRFTDEQARIYFGIETPLLEVKSENS